MISDLGIVFKVYLISLGLQLLVWPWVSKWFSNLSDRGWALGRVLGLLAISLPVWFVGHIWPVNTDLGVAIMILLLVLVGLRTLQGYDPLSARRPKGPAVETAPFRVGPLRMILMEEGLFVFGLVGLSLVRGFQPDILGLEKFMDYGFIKQYLVSSNLPVNDMWLAEKTINYYSFGHFMASILVRVWGVGLGVGYNLILAWILGSSLALSFSIVLSLGGGMFGGVVGALLTCLGGNSHIWWYLIKNRGFGGYWYANATRFIENTIHEFPGYSFVVSDLHAHVLGIPVVLGFMLVLIAVWKRLPKMNFRGITLLGVFIGVMAMTNTWDSVIYGLMLLVFGLLVLMYGKITIGKLMISVGIIGVVSLIITTPWLLNFDSFSEGVGWVGERSAWWQMVILWGGHVIVTLMAIIMSQGTTLRSLRSRARRPWLLLHGSDPLVTVMGVTALLLLAVPEIVYVKDIYPSHQRANTMFKLTYQAFIMMSLLFGWLVGKLVSSCQGSTLRLLRSRARSPWLLLQGLNPFRKLLLVFILVVWVGFMLFPLQAFNSYYGGFKDYRGLDGLMWLKKDSDGWGVIGYLSDNRDGKNMIEAVGDSYSKLNKTSAFSGVPTVVGWRVHEWLWRGGYEVVGEREKKVRDFYEKGDKKVLEEFNVGWVVVGPDEREKYKVNESKILDVGKVVWNGVESYLIRVD